MNYNTLSTIERFESEPTLWSESSSIWPLRTDEERTTLQRTLGRLALGTVIALPNTRFIDTSYGRAKGRLSADDVRELERYFDFLRQHYGVPEGASIFPKIERPLPTGRINRRRIVRTEVITQLRDIAPRHPLGYHEALRLAERQATFLLELSGTTHPAVPEKIITDLPRISVQRMAPFPTSGASHWSKGTWQVAINATEPATRQRFSLAHELKHIIDHRDVAHIYDGFPARERDQMVERVCDYFAGCLLIPRAWLTAAYANDTRHPMDLALVFGVSPSAIAVRLNQVGLARPTPRCATTPRDWAPVPRHERSSKSVGVL